MSQPYIEIQLTDAQIALSRDSIDYSASMGDCEPLDGRTLRFQDYEGAIAFQDRVLGAPRPTIREYISMQAIARKIDTAIVVWVKERAIQEGRAHCGPAYRDYVNRRGNRADS